MSSPRYRPLRHLYVGCCAFFGAYMAYTTVMLFAYAEKGDGPSNRESNACGMCHGPSANNDTLAAWGGAFHDWSPSRPDTSALSGGTGIGGNSGFE